MTGTKPQGHGVVAVGPDPGCRAQQFCRACREAGAGCVLDGEEQTDCLSQSSARRELFQGRVRSAEICVVSSPF